MVSGAELWLVGYLLSAAVMAMFTWVYWQHRSIRGVRYLAYSSALGVVMTLVYSLSLVVPSLALKGYLLKLFAALTFASLLVWFVFVTTWVDKPSLNDYRALVVVGTPVFAGSLLVFTNGAPGFDGLHRVYWTSFDLLVGNSVTPLVPSYDLGFYVVSAYTSMIFLWTIWMLVSFSMQPEQRLYRRQNAMLVVAGTSSFLTVMVFRLLGSPFDPIPISHLLAYVFAALGIVQPGIFNLSPLAGSTIVDEIDGGVLVYGTDGTVFETNRLARRLLGLDPDDNGVDVAALFSTSSLLPDVDPDLFTGGVDSLQRLDDRIDGHEFHARLDGEERTYRLDVSELSDQTDRELGRAILFYDVSDLRQKQEQLDLLKEVLSRVLRHNLRNDMTVVKGYAEIIAEDAPEPYDEMGQNVVDVADALIGTTQKARFVEKTLETERDQVVVDLNETLAEAVERVRDDYPDATIDVNDPGDIDVVGHPALDVAFENAIENGIRHNDADTPRVGVSVQVTDDAIVVRITDNGSGIPDSELSAIDSREETALDHGSGVGLWLITWLVERSGGDVSFDATGDGTVVTFEFVPGDADTEVGAATAVDAPLDRVQSRPPGETNPIHGLVRNDGDGGETDDDDSAVVDSVVDQPVDDRP